jgi:hypothetical protein
LETTKLALFFLGAFALLLAVVVELGSLLLFSTPHSAAGIAGMPRPGVGIRSLVFVDSVLLYALALIVLDFLPGIRAGFARIQGILTLILSIIGLILDIVFLFIAITLVLLMIALLLAVPFGTLAYLAVWGSFDVSGLRATLGLVMLLKIVGAVVAVISHPALLKNKGFVLLISSSLLATFLLGFLVAFPPGFLASITDVIGGIIALILALIWMLFYLIGSILAIIRAVRSVVPS